MKRVVYVGSDPDGVEIGDVGVFAPKGEPVEIEDDGLAARLLEQETNWQQPAAAAKTLKDES